MKTWRITLAILSLILSASAAQAGTICVGQTVYGNNGSDLIGRVAAVFGENIEVQWLSVNGAPYSGEANFWDASLLSPEAHCSGPICEGNSVYGNNGSSLEGVVVLVFENGKAEVNWTRIEGNSYSGNPSVWDATSLSSQSICANGLCRGEVVYGNNGSELVGVISELYSDGKAAVQWFSINGAPYSGAASYWDATSLSMQINFVAGLTTGDIVYGNNGSELVGQVSRLFANGKAEVNWTSINGQPYSGNPSFWDAITLQKRSYCAGTNPCPYNN